MEVREFALHILENERIEDKLLDPPFLTDLDPGSPLFLREPARAHNIRFSAHTRGERKKLPPLQELYDIEKRAVCLHRFCGHELLAVEMMAYALLAFPEAPTAFRRGLLFTLKEEQEHVRIYMKRLEGLGLTLGDLPLYKHFWRHTPFITSPIRYVSMMSLTFEMANLDFAPFYASAFRKIGDKESEELMNRILLDEIKHVRFGINWFHKLQQRQDSHDWVEYCESLYPYLTPKRAKGHIYQEEYRQKAGVPDDWIKKIEEA
ncbi:MAG: ferritin-like domain-containing protein [Chlamydiae bacterium]|nr:ferritin-like domain-containing protein [Chlamydiota bacterium]